MTSGVDPGAALYLVLSTVIATLGVLRLAAKMRRCVRRIKQSRGDRTAVDFRSVDEKAHDAFFGGVHDYGLVVLALALNWIGHALGILP